MGRVGLHIYGSSTFASTPFGWARLVHHLTYRRRQIARPAPTRLPVDIFQTMDQISDFATRIRSSRRSAKMRPAPERSPIIDLAASLAAQKRA